MKGEERTVSIESVETAFETLRNYLDNEISSKDDNTTIVSSKLLEQAMQELKEQAQIQ